MAAQACSYDLNAALVNPLRLTTSAGECLYCDMRCLAKWALQRATNPRLPIVDRDFVYVILMRLGTQPIELSGIQRLAAYAVNKALGNELTDELAEIRDSLAFEQATSVISSHCLSVERAGGLEDGWYDLASSEIDLADEVEYLSARHLIKRHPEHPTWVTLCDEGEPFYG